MSLAKIEASRQNAALSTGPTGPTSPEGKATSSRNAVSHDPGEYNFIVDPIATCHRPDKKRTETQRCLPRGNRQFHRALKLKKTSKNERTNLSSEQKENS